MAVLSRDEYFARMQARIGDDTSDEAITFLEDMTDTYNDLETRSKGDGIDWEKKFKDNDAAWKAKYTHRFFSGGGRSNPEVVEESDEDTGYKADEVTVDDLFEKKED